jgi:hypothetical protein
MKKVLTVSCTLLLFAVSPGVFSQDRIHLQINFDGSTGESDCTHCYNINAQAQASSANSSIPWVATGEMDQKRGCCIFTDCDYRLVFNRGLINQNLNFFPSTVSVWVQEYAAFSLIGCAGNSTDGSAAQSNSIVSTGYTDNVWKAVTVSHGSWRDVGGYKFGVKINVPQVSTFTTHRQDAGGGLVPFDRFCEGETVYLTTGYQNNILRDARFEWRYRINNAGPYTHFFTNEDTGTGSFTLPPGLPPGSASTLQLQVRLRGQDTTIPAFSFGGFTFGPFFNPGMEGPWSHVSELIVYPKPPVLNLAGLDPSRKLQVASDIVEGNSSLKVEHVTCNGGSNGRIRINTIAGAGNYLVTVRQIASGTVMNYFSGGHPSTGAPILLPDSAFAHTYNSNSPFEFTAGDYEVLLNQYTVLSNGDIHVLGCFSSQQVTIKEPEIFETNISKIKYNNNLDVSCRVDNITGQISEDGRITVAGLEGIGPYTYTLRGYTGAGKNVEVPSLMQTQSSSGQVTFSGLKAVEGGNTVYYKITATDALGCAANDRGPDQDNEFTHEYAAGTTTPSTGEELFMVVPDGLTISHFKNDYFGYDIECFGGVDNVVSFATGGSEQFDLWIEGGTLATNQLKAGIATNTPVEFTGLATGPYFIKIQDSNGCNAESLIALSQPDKLIFEASEIVKPECFGSSTGAIRLDATGGVPLASGAFNYTYTLSHDDPPPPNVWPENFNPTPADQSLEEGLFENLISGTYTAIITDRSGCQQSYPFTITEPTPIAAMISQNEIICYGEDTGHAEAAVSGGTSPYALSWLDLGEEVIHSEALDNPGQSALSDQPGGQYFLRVEDANSCVLQKVFTISEPGAPLEIFANPDDIQPVSCHGLGNGQVTLEVTGGWQPYVIGMSKSNLKLNGFSYSGLAAGTHRLYVRDFKGCMDSVDVVIFEPGILEATAINITSVSCFGATDGAFDQQITGGTAPFEILLPGSGWQPSGTITGLAAGDYDLKVRDVNGCEADFQLTLGAPDPLTITVLSSADTRCGESTGEATISISGGTGPYNTEWIFEGEQVSADVTASELAAGIYRVSVQDANGCLVTGNVGISDSNGPAVTEEEVVAVKCFGDSNGEATISITGGASPYSIVWSEGQSGTTVTGLNAAIHLVNVTDAEGCTTVAEVDVPGPEALNGTFTDIVGPYCFGDLNGSLGIDVSGGVAPYTYEWISVASFDNAVSGIGSGVHSVQITDFNGCTLNTSYNLQQPDPVEVDLGGIAYLCTGQSITLDAGNAGATYQWQSAGGNFSTSQTVDVSESGLYSVTVTDARGCQGTDTFELVVDADILQGDFIATSEAVAGDTVVFIDISFPIPESTYWEFPAGATLYESTPFDQKVIFDEAGIYPVSLFVTKGDCFDEITRQITVSAKTDNSGGRTSSGSSLVVEFQVFPNPTGGRFNVDVLLREDAPMHLEIYSMDGYRSWGSYKEQGHDHYVVEVDLTEAPSGLYSVFLEAGDERVVKRIMIY